MISHPVHLLSPPEQASAKSRANAPTGLRDFGALLQAQETDGKTPQGTEGRTAREPATPVHASEALHPIANAGLSGLVYAQAAASQPALLAALLEAGAAVEAKAPQEPMPRVAVESEAARSADGARSTPAPANVADRDATIADRTPASVEIATASTESTATWAERSLRWLPTLGGGGTTAWIRDYRLDPSQATRLVDSLRRLAQQQGRQLDRIVLNGHELWRAASTSDI